MTAIKSMNKSGGFLTWISAILFLLHTQIEAQKNLPDDSVACENATALNASARLTSVTTTKGDNCDNNLTEGWYRFLVNGQSAELPNVCLKNDACGTQLPLRLDLDGKALSEGNTTLWAYVCTAFDVLGKWDCCVLRQRVGVRKCADGYVYHLKPVDRCSVAYCVQDPDNMDITALTVKTGDSVRRNTVVATVKTSSDIALESSPAANVETVKIHTRVTESRSTESEYTGDSSSVVEGQTTSQYTGAFSDAGEHQSTVIEATSIDSASDRFISSTPSLVNEFPSTAPESIIPLKSYLVHQISATTVAVTSSSSGLLSSFAINQFINTSDVHIPSSNTTSLLSFIKEMSFASNIDSSSIDGIQSFVAPSHSVFLTKHQTYSSIDQLSASSAVSLFSLTVTEQSMSNPALEISSAVFKETFATTIKFSENHSSVADTATGTPAQNPETPSYLSGNDASRSNQTVASELTLETSRTAVAVSFQSAEGLTIFEMSTKTEITSSQIFTSSDLLKTTKTPIIVSPYSTSYLMPSESSMTSELSTSRILMVECSQHMLTNSDIISDPQATIDVSALLSRVTNTAFTISEPTNDPVTSVSGDEYETNRTSDKELVDVFKDSFGLFVFLIVVGAVLLIVFVFGLSAYIHQTKMRNWNPRMAGQDAYSNMEKSPLSFGKNAARCSECPVPHLDILDDGKHEEETSLSQASTLLCRPASSNLHSVNGNVSAMSESSPETNNQNHVEESSSIIAKEDEHVLHGQINKAFEDGEADHFDGMVPVDELDYAPPRAFFPWIENAADTKL